ncbi:MAG: hypothetical protein KA956_08520 [Pyrinomonadaceae bacterium]|nr:hypothetical protein [Acidobacteriota bacterium]MBP7376510.1 hypothetical protein [Pyrinomonadaceae bacterium]
MTKTLKTKSGAAKTRRNGAVLGFAVFLLTSFSFACGPNEDVLKSGRSNSVSEDRGPTRTSIEADIYEMRTANFIYIYVLRRKDGGEIDSEDRGALKLNTEGVNRRISSDNGKAFVIGSNSAIPADKMFALYDRFAVENYSQPEKVIENGNANTK